MVAIHPPVKTGGLLATNFIKSNKLLQMFSKRRGDIMSKPEPLKGKKLFWLHSTRDIVDSDGKVVKKANKGAGATAILLPDDVKSGFEFYFKYVNNPTLLVLDYPEYRKDVNRFGHNIRVKDLRVFNALAENCGVERAIKEFMRFHQPPVRFKWEEYEDWLLFELAFADVFENDNKGD